MRLSLNELQHYLEFLSLITSVLTWPQRGVHLRLRLQKGTICQNILNEAISVPKRSQKMQKGPSLFSLSSVLWPALPPQMSTVIDNSPLPGAWWHSTGAELYQSTVTEDPPRPYPCHSESYWTLSYSAPPTLGKVYSWLNLIFLPYIGSLTAAYIPCRHLNWYRKHDKWFSHKCDLWFFLLAVFLWGALN